MISFNSPLAIICFVYCPTHTPITVVWNKNLFRCVSTGGQDFKEFTDLSKDLPFLYDSLTTWRTTFRTCFGPINTSVFDVPGTEFFGTTGEDEKVTVWWNPTGLIYRGGWSRHNDQSCEGRNGSSKLVSDWELWTTYPRNFYPYGLCSFSHAEHIHTYVVIFVSCP